jgi:hypothetical protein
MFRSRAGGVGVHQRRLGEADERSRGRVADDERDEQGPEASGRRGQGGREREGEAAADEQKPAAGGVAGRADQRVEGAPYEARDREHEPDLGVAQAEVVADRRQAAARVPPTNSSSSSIASSAATRPAARERADQGLPRIVIGAFSRTRRPKCDTGAEPTWAMAPPDTSGAWHRT